MLLFFYQQDRSYRCKNWMVLILKFFKYLLYFVIKTPKLVLPDALFELLIQSKHFTVFGLHNSITSNKQDNLQQFHVSQKVLRDKLQMLKTNCLVCQLNKTNSISQDF